MELLERKTYLNELNQSLHELSTDGGRVVLIFGEAGIGKTSLVEAFINQSEGKARILWGACDALFTPRPLGPLFDIADNIQRALSLHLQSNSSRDVIFFQLLRDLQTHTAPNILVIEDVHWADNATLDFIKFLGRRIHKSNTLFIITFRDDEVLADHPFRSVLGDISTKHIQRMPILPLSEKTVNMLAEQKELKNLYTMTGGNPFLVTELLNNDSETVPSTIKDSITSRIMRLSPKAIALIELVSVIPNRAEHWLLQQIVENDFQILDECIHSGILHTSETAVSFRHELSRMAVEESLPVIKKQRLCEQVLQVLLRQQAIDQYLARIIHYASGAGNINILIQYLPLAAEQAAKLGAHHQAVSHYKRLLEIFEGIDEQQHALLLEKYSYECYLTDRLEEALQARLQALTIWKRINNQKKIGSNLRWLSRLSWFLGRKHQADSYASEAVRILEPLIIDEELAMAYSNKAQLHALSQENQKAIAFGTKAATMAESLGNTEILVHALNNIGMAEMERAYTANGEEKLTRSLSLSLENRFDEHVVRAYTNLGCRAVEHKLYAKGLTYFNEGISYCIDHDLDSWKFYMQAWLSRLYFETGQWNDAGILVQSILKNQRLSIVSVISAQTILGRLRLRRGDPDAKALLWNVSTAALETNEIQRMGPVSVALLECRWLIPGNELTDTIIDNAYHLAFEKKDTWLLGELVFWKKRCGIMTDIPEDVAEPYAKQLSGDWQGAAAYWNSVSRPYDEALALMDGNEDALFKALEIFRKLEAKPAEELLLKMMREKGIRSIPRGPHTATVQNPFELTNRQMEVLKLLAAGLSNAHIAHQLFISQKTVDHHISAIFEKLNIHSRTEAAAIAHTYGLLKK